MKIATSPLVSGFIICLYDHLVLLSVMKFPHIADCFSYCRVEGGILPLVELLESPDRKVQRGQRACSVVAKSSGRHLSGPEFNPRWRANFALG
jgi:hypothetical protein